MGRHALAAFPCFAVAAGLLAHRRWLAPVWLVPSAAAAVMMSSLFGRWYLL
jgi:hypothetical protein